MPKRKTPPPKTSWLTAQKLWVFSAAAFIILGALAAWLMQPTSYGLTLTHLTSNTLLSQNGTTFIGASRQIFDLELRWYIAGLMFVSAVGSLLRLSRYRQRFEGWHWADMAFSFVVMTELFAVLCGLTDVATLKLIGTLTFVTFGLRWLSQQQNIKVRKPVWSAFGFSLFTGVMPWVMILITAGATVLYGSVRSPWYVYAAGAAVLVGYKALTWLQWRWLRARLADNDLTYQLVNNLTKMTFAIVLIVGLR